MHRDNKDCRTNFKSGIALLSPLEFFAANTILEALRQSRQSGALRVSICLPAA
jgi:hypothetical protein